MSWTLYKNFICGALTITQSNGNLVTTGDATIGGAANGILNIRSSTNSQIIAQTLAGANHGGYINMNSSGDIGLYSQGGGYAGFTLNGYARLKRTDIGFDYSTGSVINAYGTLTMGYSYGIVTYSLQTNGGRIGHITTATDTYAILVTDETIICNKATAFTVTLPTAALGQRFNIKNIGAGTVTVDGASTDLIDGSETQLLYQWDGIQIQCSAANTWVVI